MTARPGLAAVALAGLVPWVIVIGGGPEPPITLVFAFGLVTPEPLHLTTLPAYLTTLTRGLPQSLLAWPVATLLWLGAASNGLSGAFAGREDRRVTGGLLVLSGVSLLPVAMAVGRPPGVTALPVGIVGLWTVAWWRFGEDLRRIVVGGSAAER